MAPASSVDVRNNLLGHTAPVSHTEPVITYPVASVNASMLFQLMASPASQYQVIKS